MNSYIQQAFEAWAINPTVQTQSALLALLLAEREARQHTQDTEMLLEYANLCM